MDFNLTEEQQMLRKTARDFMEKECPKSLVREMENDENGYSPELWHKMVKLGWLGLIFPEEYGGGGGNYIDLIVLLEEFGRALVPGPFLSTVVYCGLPVLDKGTEKQKQDILPKIAKGQMIMSLALSELSASHQASGIAVKAIQEKDDYIINGTKLFVPDAHVADWLLCATRTKETEREEEGITLFLVNAKSPGINCTPSKDIASDTQCEVVFNSVRVPKDNILGRPDHGWEIVKKVTEQAAIAQCALMVGGSQYVLEMTVSYAKDRVQFGRPIGSFQIIQHKCADMATDLDSTRFITYEAAWKLSESLPATMEVAMAKACASEAYGRICAHGHQIQAGVGLMKDHDMQLYFRRAKTAEAAFGDPDFHREIVAQQLLL